MVQQLTALIEDLRRLVLEIEKSQKDGGQQDKKNVRILEGQIRTRDPDTVLASKLKNAAIYSPDESRIGDVHDLIIKADGRVEGVVVGVAGGEKDVALKLERFEVTPEPNGSARIVFSAEKEELEGLEETPSFNAQREQQDQKSLS
jgi:sporulation protein YlmC with PRC-barrel domain